MSEKIIKDQEETKEETKIGSEEIVKNGETKTGSEEIVKNEEKEVPEKVDANSSFWSKVKHFLKYSIQTWIARCFLIAFGLELLMEILGRRSLVLGVKFMVSSPIVFLYNTSIIFFTLLFALFLRKRVFGIVLISIVWLICGFANFVVLGYRITPFAAIDLLMVKDVISMLDVYFSKVQQVLLVVAAVAVIAGIVILFRKSPKFEGKKHVMRTMVVCIVMWIGIMLFTNFNVSHNIISDDFANLGMAYQDYGFAYCFTNSIIDNGISKPDDYDETTMLHLRNKLNSEELEADTSKKKTPNIICVQLESFFDPKVVKGLTLSEDPVPNFTRLKEKFPSGYLTMPALGAGTANSEFEVLTGIRSAYFGAGEYPYKTTVNKKPIEGMCSLLEKEGYHTFAMHNNKSSFYDRKDVYNEMGFERFISLEYMYNVEKTSTGWAKDEILVNNIKNCLRSTEGQDFVFTISVQGHGKYPEELGACDEKIKVSYPQDPVKENQLTYYVNQIHEMDIFVKELTTKLADYPEPVVLVMYGDHLPTMGLKVEDLENRYLYQTEYVIWDNMGLKRKQENIASYQIAAEVMNRVGIHDGTIFRYHQTRRNTKNYQVDLEVLQYDMLYGKRYVYGEDGETPYERVKLQMGALPVTLERIEKSGEDTWYFYGENFTASSRVEVNEEIQDTVYVSPSILMVHGLTLEDGDQITIAQQSNSSTKKVLTRTEPMMYEEPKTVSTPTPMPNPDSTKTDVTQENANTSTAPQDELTAAPSGAPEGEGDKIEPSKTENSDKPAEDGGLQN